MKTSYEYNGPFLELWPAARRSLIVNQFCFAVRKGAKDVRGVLVRVGEDAQQRFAEHGDAGEQGEAQRILLLAIETDEAYRFADFILWRESLPYSERRRLKDEAGQDYRAAYMARNPPTDKQLKYLEALACHVIPANRLEASQLIEKYKNGNVPRS